MLSPFQERLARLFLSMPEAQDFALAGGAALVFRNDVSRQTQDLDFFTPVVEEVPAVFHRFAELLAEVGLDFQVIHASPSFARLRVREPAGEEALVDIGYDYRLMEPGETPIGRVLQVEELAADKLLALFGRAEARDFVDVYVLAARFGIDAMMSWARQKDPGFDPHVLAVMIGHLDRLRREEFDVDEQDFGALRAFFAELRASLIHQSLGRAGTADDAPDS
ncbi:nucleotidyl transferase AbiEii/AbiGii toxin family protein [Limnochorda pilosa]|uniref:Nucleotidyl transferase AbiEii/AbiGii toxin family protein n=1 Tax=Limnochorda pilosa TaxID=1555112 RepID=A0A0K2SI75_LIMPI|nr:nucleotidyl transferase AbiEii/AbiGii toxin family protein [Limnochorda pilosa]BAS26717.1 hypothetical protein LIP_0860 [Limnochorda pilosa]